jgi:hypothetical protein
MERREKMRGGGREEERKGDEVALIGGENPESETFGSRLSEGWGFLGYGAEVALVIRGPFRVGLF